MILLAVVLSAAYSAALISFLTSGTTVLPFRSLKGFVEDGTYQLSVFRGSADYDMFAYSQHPFEKKLMKLMIEKKKLTSNIVDGFKKVCDNRKLAIYTSEEVQKITNLKITCNLVAIDTGRVDNLAMILSKNNPFTDVINFHLQKFIDNGMINRLKDTTFKKKLNDVMKHKPVRINNVMSLIFFIQTGIILKLQESLYYVRQTRPHYIAVLSSYKAINEFSLATNNFDMSFATWLVIFAYKGHGSDYCYNPPGNIFHLKFNTNMLVRCGRENILREWYSIDSNRTEINDFATWSSEKGIIKMVPDSLYDRRYNLQGLTMKAVIVQDSPFININKEGEIDGVFGRILRELCVTLNFTFNIVSEVEEYGSWNPKEKTWSGAVGELYAGRADISISDFSITSARFNAVDFTFPLLISRNCLYIQEPHIFAIQWSSYFLAFSHSVWIAMFGISIFVMISLIFFKIKNRTDRNIGYLLSDNILEIWGILCQQGLPDFPERLSLRIPYISIFFMASVLLAAYSAAFISFLTTGIHTLPFRSLETFVEDGTYQLAVFRGTADYEVFTNSKNPLAKEMIKMMIKEEELPLTLLEGFQKICENRKLASYTYCRMKKSLSPEIPCKVIAINAGPADSLSMILSKHNPFTGVINFHLQKFVNNGVMQRLKDRDFQKKFNDITNYHGPVPITSVISLIFFIQIGITLSIFILIIEKCIFARKNKKRLIIDRIPSIESLEFDMKRKKNVKNIVNYHATPKCQHLKY
uniref:Ionotropic glutamate receptor L-glutamate and glycine-binding domain-containing protein n=1 Tax=Vespula pensylvanica TaxID=30213 RepID=A0A834P1L2_VESPE|nr:hypothetical protein H0235_007634 [Vespula pensylvanica]